MNRKHTKKAREKEVIFSIKKRDGICAYFFSIKEAFIKFSRVVLEKKLASDYQEAHEKNEEKINTFW